MLCIGGGERFDNAHGNQPLRRLACKVFNTINTFCDEVRFGLLQDVWSISTPKPHLNHAFKKALILQQDVARLCRCALRRSIQQVVYEANKGGYSLVPIFIALEKLPLGIVAHARNDCSDAVRDFQLTLLKPGEPSKDLDPVCRRL